jgi:hypothetical protein
MNLSIHLPAQRSCAGTLAKRSFETRWLWVFCLSVVCSYAAEDPRSFLPDYSEGLTGRLGPFWWSRAADLGEDARFCDADGRPRTDGDYLWCFQFNRAKRTKGLTNFVHARSNFVSRDATLAFTVQPVHILHNTTGAHNSKIIFGYMEKHWPFQHADNCDLAHLAGADRVVVFFPVRHDGAKSNHLDQAIYHVNPNYGAQTPCVIEFKAGEIISYDWFRNPANLDAHILFDLQPHVKGMRPGIEKPVLRFDLIGDGGWRLAINDKVFTHESPGAKPYTVNVTPTNSAWALSVFSPGGSPPDTSEIILGLKPYDRVTGGEVPWPDRKVRVRDTAIRIDGAK